MLTFQQLLSQAQYRLQTRNRTLYGSRVISGRFGEEPDPNSEEKPPVVYTREEVDKMLEAEKARFNADKKKQLEQLEQFKSSNSLSEKDKKELQKQIETLQNSLKTKEELQRETLEKKDKEYTERVQSLEAQEAVWKSRYFNEMCDRQILDASTTHKAFNAQQIKALLMPSVQMVDDLDADNNPTGNFVPKVKFVDKNGKELVLSISEAVEKMKDTPSQYGNLFNSGKIPGFNSTQPDGKTRPLTRGDLRELTQEEYMKNHAAIKQQGVLNDDA